MGNFNRDKGRGGFGSKSFGSRDQGSKSVFKYDAICSKCGKPCQVPFRPAGDRPVFCRDCFTKPVGGNNMPPRPLTSNFDRPRFESKPSADGISLDQMKQQFGMLHAKLDAILRNLPALQVAPSIFKEEAKIEVKETKKPKKVAVKKPTAKKKK